MSSWEGRYSGGSSGEGHLGSVSPFLRETESTSKFFGSMMIQVVIGSWAKDTLAVTMFTGAKEGFML